MPLFHKHRIIKPFLLTQEKEMKYTLTISGRGATVSFGSLSDEIYKYVKTFESPKA